MSGIKWWVPNGSTRDGWCLVYWLQKGGHVQHIMHRNRHEWFGMNMSWKSQTQTTNKTLYCFWEHRNSFLNYVTFLGKKQQYYLILFGARGVSTNYVPIFLRNFLGCKKSWNVLIIESYHHLQIQDMNQAMNWRIPSIFVTSYLVTRYYKVGTKKQLEAGVELHL